MVKIVHSVTCEVWRARWLHESQTCRWLRKVLRMVSPFSSRSCWLLQVLKILSRMTDAGKNWVGMTLCSDVFCIACCDTSAALFQYGRVHIVIPRPSRRACAFFVGWHACASTTQTMLQGVQTRRKHHRAHVWDHHHYLFFLWLARPIVLRMGVQPSATSAVDYLLSPVVSQWATLQGLLFSARADVPQSVFESVGLWILDGRSSAPFISTDLLVKSCTCLSLKIWDTSGYSMISRSGKNYTMDAQSGVAAQLLSSKIAPVRDNVHCNACMQERPRTVLSRFSWTQCAPTDDEVWGHAFQIHHLIRNSKA